MVFGFKHRGGAHTSGDTMVWLPQKNVLFSGDVVYVDRLPGVIPVSNTKAWLASFAVIEQLNPKLIVPGHATRRLIGEGALLVDVRERPEIERVPFDVPDLVVMPMSELERRFAELPRDRRLVLVCESGARSLKATYFLMYQGYTQVVNMEGGLLKWARKGLPVRGDVAQANACACGDPADGSCCAPAPTSGAGCCG